MFDEFPPVFLYRRSFEINPDFSRSANARLTVLLDNFKSDAAVPIDGKHFPSLSARLCKYKYTATAR